MMKIVYIIEQVLLHAVLISGLGLLLGYLAELLIDKLLAFRKVGMYVYNYAIRKEKIDMIIDEMIEKEKQLENE